MKQALDALAITASRRIAPSTAIATGLVAPLALAAPGNLDTDFADHGRIVMHTEHGGQAWSIEALDNGNALVAGGDVDLACSYWSYYCEYFGSNFAGELTGAGQIDRSSPRPASLASRCAMPAGSQTARSSWSAAGLTSRWRSPLWLCTGWKPAVLWTRRSALRAFSNCPGDLRLASRCELGSAGSRRGNRSFRVQRRAPDRAAPPGRRYAGPFLWRDGVSVGRCTTTRRDPSSNGRLVPVIGSPRPAIRSAASLGSPPPA